MANNNNSGGGSSTSDYTIVEYYAEHEGYRCGYCKSPDTNFSHGMWGHCVNIKDYEGLLNRGWRRSGSYLYKPTNNLTCCPMYTISCHALDFKLSKSQKKVLKKFHAHLGVKDNKEKGTVEDYLLQEQGKEGTLPGFKVKWVKGGSEEMNKSLPMEHELYKKYQMKIHEEKEEECDFRQFKRFLCRTPLTSSSPNHGSFHHQYFINDKLIAVGVVDVLPTCLSSVYFFYDPDLSQLSLGNFGALYEILFVRQMHKQFPEFKYYYLGFYIHSCQKMKYKGNYSPSYLLCPETYRWKLLDDGLRKRLDEQKYLKFGGDEESQEGRSEQGNEDIAKVTLLYKKCIMPYAIYKSVRKSDDDTELQQYVNLVGAVNSSSILLYRE